MGPKATWPRLSLLNLVKEASPTRQACRLGTLSTIPGVTPRFVEEFLNALSVEAAPLDFFEIATLQLVSKIRPVPGGCAILEGCGVPPPTGIGRVDTGLVALTLILSGLAGAAAIVTAIPLKRA